MVGGVCDRWWVELAPHAKINYCLFSFCVGFLTEFSLQDVQLHTTLTKADEYLQVHVM